MSVVSTIPPVADVKTRPGIPVGARRFVSSLDRFLLDQIPTFERELREIIQFALSHSGKRLRPVLVFTAGSPDGKTFQEQLIRAAAVVEMVHLATLVHDDVLDDADLRHRQETVARRFGVSAAILAGDALFAQALRLASDFDTTLVCRMVSEATRKVCAGEVEQTFNRISRDGGIERYFRVIDRKTAELFRVSCALGSAIFAPEAEERIRATSDFGRHLGLAYQIYDDLVDLLGDEKKVGKTLGTDLQGEKLTLPLLLLGDSLSEVLDGSSQAVDPSLVRELLFSRGIPSRVESYFSIEVEKGHAALEPLKGDVAGQGLANLLASVQFRMEQLLSFRDSTGRDRQQVT